MSRKAITITESAQKRLVSLCELHNQTKIKLTITRKGCSGNSYKMDFVDSADKFDEVYQLDGIEFIVDGSSVMFVVGTELDWVEQGLESKFEFKNPNAKSKCGCGESFFV